MPSKTTLPTREEVEAQAADLAAQLDTYRQQDQQQAAEDHRRKLAAQQEFDEQTAAGFSRAQVEAEVDRARAAFDEALATNPLVLALADYLASLRRRSHAMHEHMATLGRLGRPTAPPNAGPTELYDLEGTIFRAAELIAADRVAAEQTDLHARRDAAGDNPKETTR